MCSRRMALCLRTTTTPTHRSKRTARFIRNARSTQITSHVGSQLSTPNVVTTTTTNGQEEEIVTEGFSIRGWD